MARPRWWGQAQDAADNDKVAQQGKGQRDAVDIAHSTLITCFTSELHFVVTAGRLGFKYGLWVQTGLFQRVNWFFSCITARLNYGGLAWEKVKCQGTWRLNNDKNNNIPKKKKDKKNKKRESISGIVFYLPSESCETVREQQQFHSGCKPPHPIDLNS